MRNKKDTLGFKYKHFATIYKMNDEHFGKLMKYLLWIDGEDYILDNAPEKTRNNILKYVKRLEDSIDDLLEDFAFEQVYNATVQQVKESHRCWQQLKDNIDGTNNKSDGDKEPTMIDDYSDKEEITPWYHFNGDRCCIDNWDAIYELEDGKELDCDFEDWMSENERAYDFKGTSYSIETVVADYLEEVRAKDLPF